MVAVMVMAHHITTHMTDMAVITEVCFITIIIITIITPQAQTIHPVQIMPDGPAVPIISLLQIPTLINLKILQVRTIVPAVANGIPEATVTEAEAQEAQEVPVVLGGAVLQVEVPVVAVEVLQVAIATEVLQVAVEVHADVNSNIHTSIRE